MSGEHLKTPFAQTLPKTIDGRVDSGIGALGNSFPASVVEVISSGIVRVKFEVNADPFTLNQIVAPVAMAQYVRLPIQVGDMGWLVPASVRMGGVTGLGSGTPDLTRPANLSALQFLPVANANWPSVDLNMLVLYGPNGVLIEDQAGTALLNVTPDGITASFGGNGFEITADGVNITGPLTINGDAYLDHEHSDVQSGGDNTGGVV